MNDLYRALGDISSIRRQVANATEFRGYGPSTLAATGAFAAVAATVQAVRVSDPGNHIGAYLSIWIATAVVSAVLAGVQMHARSRRIHSALSDEMIRMAVEQFLPAAGAGLLVTVVILRCARPEAWMIPGLWQIIFSLGVLSSCRFLPKAMIAAGAWYLLTGLCCVAMGGERALSPWAMGVPFGVGQLLVAGILRFSAAEASDAE